MKIYLIAFINLFFTLISYSQSNWNSTYDYPLKDAMSKVKDPFKKDNLKNNYASLLKTSIAKGVDIDGKTPNVTLRIRQSKLEVPNKRATELQQKTNPKYDLKVLLSDFSLIMGPYDKNPVSSYVGEFNDNDLPINRGIPGYIGMVFEFLIDDKHRGTFYTMATSNSQFQSNVDISEISGSDRKLYLYKMKHIDLTYNFYDKTEYYHTDDDDNPSTSYREENYLKWMDFLKNLKSGNKLYIRFLGFTKLGVYDEEMEKCGSLISLNWDLYMECRKKVHGKFKFQPADYKSSTYEFSLNGSSNALSF